MGQNISVSNQKNMFCCNCERDKQIPENKYTKWIDLAIHNTNNENSIDNIKKLMKHKSNDRRRGISRISS